MNQQDRAGIDELSLMLGELKEQSRTNADSIQALRIEIAKLTQIKDQGKGWLSAIVLVAGIVGAVISGVASALIGRWA
jgi:hypothetical protein